jgi:Cu+-exporting ATPase
LEQASEHPLSAAIVTSARERGLRLSSPQNFEYLPGRGIRGVVDGKHIAIGSEIFLRESGVEFASPQDVSSRTGPHGIVYVALDGHAAGYLEIADPVKQDAAAVIRDLRAQGVKVVMLTGDNRLTAAAIADELGIAEFEAEALPEQKLAVIKKLQQEGRVVAMAGDGINDAPALAQADVGVAMGTGTDIAMESGGITLIKGDLRGLLRARRLSQATLRNIKQNLFFAFVYNLLGVPIAAGILYPFFGILLSPVIAAAAMSFSSVSVITNSLRLRNAKL